MSIERRLRRARATLLGGVLVSAAGWGATVAAALLCLAALVDRVAPLPLDLRTALVPLALTAGGVALLIVLFRGRRAVRLERVALFLEERVPLLEYALVTALGQSGPAASALERVVDRAAPERVLRRAIARAVALPAAALAVTLLVLLVLLPVERRRILTPAPGDVLLTGSADPLASRVEVIAVRVTPPAYARQPARESADPVSVSGLVGSRVEIRGRGASRGGLDSMAARIGASALPVRAAGDTWSVALTMPGKAVALLLADRGFDRLLALEPVADQPPIVTLTAPSRDTTYPVPRGRLVLAGAVRDDIGLALAAFELMHTSGSGERFDIRRLALGTVSPRGARTATLTATLLLDTLKLGAGDVLHVRVTARDENAVSGPGEGASDTRTIRIADPRLRDTVQVIAAAVAELDTTMLSQRMLVIRAETLLVQRRRIRDSAYRSRSELIGHQQGQLRERVEAIIEELTTATDAGFTGDTKSSIILGEAVGAMKLAQRELGVFRVSAALPHMYRALKALERVRSADRLYLRGILPKLVVDVEKIRLKGTDQPAVGAREPRPPVADPRMSLRARVESAVTLLRRGGDVRDSLVVIRVDALGQAPAAAAHLATAIEALRAGRDPLPAIRSARRVLLRETDASPAVPVWRGAP